MLFDLSSILQGPAPERKRAIAAPSKPMSRYKSGLIERPYFDKKEEKKRINRRPATAETILIFKPKRKETAKIISINPR